MRLPGCEGWVGLGYPSGGVLQVLFFKLHAPRGYTRKRFVEAKPSPGHPRRVTPPWGAVGRALNRCGVVLLRDGTADDDACALGVRGAAVASTQNSDLCGIPAGAAVCAVTNKKGFRRSLFKNRKVIRRAYGTHRYGYRFQPCRPEPQKLAHRFRNRWRSWQASAPCRRCRPLRRVRSR